MGCSINELKKVYDDTYEKIDGYNYYDVVKNIYVDCYAAFVEGPILDAGCGEGIHLKRLLKKGYEAFGIEISSVCCEKYLQGVKHKNIDIVSYAKEGQQYAGLICMDVLEHVPYAAIEETIASLSTLSPSAFFGIANHSDVLGGVELHLIREKSEWWSNQLGKYFSVVEFVKSFHDDKFFLFQCNNVNSRLRPYMIKMFENLTEVVLLQENLVAVTRERSVLADEKVLLQETKVSLLNQNARLEDERATLKSEVTALNRRYKYFERLRLSKVGKVLRRLKG